MLGEMIYERYVSILDLYKWKQAWEKKQNHICSWLFPCYFTGRSSMETTLPAGSWLPCRTPRFLTRKIFNILSWSWLIIWFQPMGWPVLGHVTGINSATTTCQSRPANHDLCVSLAFELIRKRSLMTQYATKWRDYKVFDMETHILLTF